MFGLGVLPLVKRLALHFELYDSAGPLKIHQGSIPRLGGIAMFVGFLASSLILYFGPSRPSVLPLGIFATVWLVGLIDDIRSLGSLFRFCFHIGAGCAFWFAGWRLQWFVSPLVDLVATCLFVAFLINAMNLLDGMDGLAAGTAAIVCVGFIIISSSEANTPGITVAASLVGACAAMLSVNAPPAQMFMGDSGSTLLGVVLAFLSLNFVRSQSDPHSILTPLIFLGVPLTDALLAILRRARNPRLLFQGDRRHFYDLLLQRGWSVSRVLRVSIVVTGILVFAGWLSERGFAGAWFIGVVVLFGLAGCATLLGSLHSDSKSVHSGPQETSLGSALE